MTTTKHVVMNTDGSIQWHKKHERCAACGTQRFPHKARGYCYRCHPLVTKIEKLQMEMQRPASSKQMFPHETQQVLIVNTKRLLQNLRELEAPFLSGPKGEHISALLTTLARVTGASSNGAHQHYETGNLWERILSQEAKQWLYLVLVDIVEHFPSKNARAIWQQRQ